MIAGVLSFDTVIKVRIEDFASDENSFSRIQIDLKYLVSSILSNYMEPCDLLINCLGNVITISLVFPDKLIDYYLTVKVYCIEMLSFVPINSPEMTLSVNCELESNGKTITLFTKVKFLINGPTYIS